MAGMLGALLAAMAASVATLGGWWRWPALAQEAVLAWMLIRAVKLAVYDPGWLVVGILLGAASPLALVAYFQEWMPAASEALLVTCGTPLMIFLDSRLLLRWLSWQQVVEIWAAFYGLGTLAFLHGIRRQERAANPLLKLKYSGRGNWTSATTGRRGSEPVDTASEGQGPAEETLPSIVRAGPRLCGCPRPMRRRLAP